MAVNTGPFLEHPYGESPVPHSRTSTFYIGSMYEVSNYFVPPWPGLAGGLAARPSTSELARPEFLPIISELSASGEGEMVSAGAGGKAKPHLLRHHCLPAFRVCLRAVCARTLFLFLELS